MPPMLPRLPRVVRIAHRLAETGRFENLGVIERELAVLGFAEEMRPLAIPVFDGPQLLHSRNFSGGTASDGSAQIATPER
jgi:hypothetical protein